MTTVEYKILFEVRVLHDYYLYGVDPLEKRDNQKVEKSFFAMNSASQSARLQELLRQGRYDMRNDLEFVVGSIERRMLADLRLRLVITSTGFFVGMEVKPTTATGGEVLFRPVIPPPDDAIMTFGIVLSNISFGAISNLRLDRDSPNIYLFTNEGDHDGMSLSKPIERLVRGQRYRMGDLALVGQSLRQAITDNTGDAKFWEPVFGGAFVNQGDRSLNPEEEWFRRWRSSLERPSTRPAGVIQIVLNVRNGDPIRSPLRRDGLLATRKIPGTGRPIHPVFELRLLSSATYWRYRKMGGFSDDEAGAIKKHAGGFLDQIGNDFVTKTPRRLARELPDLPLVAAPESFRLPNAEPGSIKAGAGKLFSDVYLNFIIPTKP